jgi:outer membrane protein TolC
VVALVPRVSGAFRYQRLSHLDAPSFGSGALVGTLAPAGTVITSVSPSSPLAAVDLGKAFTFPENSTTIQASLTLPITDYVLRLAQGYEAAKRTRTASELLERAAALKAASDARVLYYTWARARLQTLVAEQALLQAQGHLTDVQHQFEAGAVSRADVLRVESQVATSELLVERARDAVMTSEEALRVALHERDAAPYAIGEDLAPGPADRVADGTMPELYAESITNRLEVRSLGESAAALRKQAQAAKAGYYPVISGVADVVYANPNQRVIPPQDRFDFTWDVGLQASWSPNDVAASDAAVKSAAAKARGVDAQRRQLEDGLRNEVAQTQAALREALVAIGTTQRGLAAAEESYRVRRVLFQNGRATSVELTDAETDLTRARFDAINARLDVRVARVRLEHALGRDVQRK